MYTSICGVLGSAVISLWLMSAEWCSVIVNGDVADQDAEFVHDEVRQGTSALDEYFADCHIAPLLHNAEVRLVLHAEAGPLANVSTATTRSGTNDGSVETYFAEIHMLAPSRVPAGALTSSGQLKDESYFGRLIVHELSTVPLDLVTRAKPEGWRLRSAPEWFVQGYQEYLGLTLSRRAVQAGSLERYVEIVRREPDRVSADFGLDVRGPYVTGAVLLLFLHETYGAERVRAVLRSDEPTFGRAMRAEIGVDLTAFMRDWRAWLDEQE